MKLNSVLTSGLATSYSLAMDAGGIEVPETLLPVTQLPMPLQAFAPTGGLSMTGVEGSGLFLPIMNIGASSGPQTQFIFDVRKGLYRIQGTLWSIVLVGPAPSSASPLACRIAAYNDIPGTFASPIATTPVLVGTPVSNNFDVTLNITDYRGFYLESFISTGVGQSIGVWATVYLSKLL